MRTAYDYAVHLEQIRKVLRRVFDAQRVAYRGKYDRRRTTAHRDEFAQRHRALTCHLVWLCSQHDQVVDEYRREVGIETANI